MNRVVLAGLCLALVAVVANGCSSPNDGEGDTGNGTSDTRVPRVDTGLPTIDKGVPPVDTGIAPVDTGIAPVDTGTIADSGTDAAAPNDANVLYPDGALMCSAGIECTNYEAALAAAPRDASGDTQAAALANCVIQMHRADCCGAMHANGINHGARTTLCPAEASCVAMYPASPGCSSDTITTDTGETTTVMANVRLRAVRPTACATGTCYTCETFVCTSDPCRSAPGIAGGCG
jgi:hypothetical protein